MTTRSHASPISTRADPLLATRLADALAANAMVDGGGECRHGSRRRPLRHRQARLPAGAAQANNARYAEIVHAAGGFLRQPDGPKVAVFDTTGWDTHANEGGAEGQLRRPTRVRSTRAWRRCGRNSGPAWSDTAVLLVTEFGRTAAVNGTRGTDHGTAAAAFLMGGAVAGGRVIADWPGLSARGALPGTRPCCDARSALGAQGIADRAPVGARRARSTTVFPDSAAAKPLRGLLRS